jgi:hypothetical protein
MKRRKAKFLGVMPVEMDVESIVDKESGKEMKEKKPWWSFLTS